jgi:hypothetical protein
VAFSLIVAARLAAHAGQWEQAAVLHAKAESMLDGIGLVLYEDDQRESDAMLSATRAALGDDRYAAARADGHGLDVMAASDLADGVLSAMSMA